MARILRLCVHLVDYTYQFTNVCLYFESDTRLPMMYIEDCLRYDSFFHTLL